MGKPATTDTREIIVEILLDLEKEQQYWEAVTGWLLKIEEESADVAA